MRIYDNCHEMHSEVKRDLHEMGTMVHPQTMQDKQVATNDDYRTLELAPYEFTILDGGDRDHWLGALGLNLEWCVKDFDERTICLTDPLGAPVNPGRAWMLRREVWQQFLEPSGKFAYTYSERLGAQIGAEGGTTAVERVLDELKKHPDSRQCVLPIFSARQDLRSLGGAHRVPCSLHYQFMRRGGELRMIYVMRSTDFITHFPYDIWMALELQALFAARLGIAPGRFVFFTGSLHIYAKDADPGIF
jgi:thymidylate synthase